MYGVTYTVYQGPFLFNLISLTIGLFGGRQVATLTGHTMRVLYLASSPDGQVNPNAVSLYIVLMMNPETTIYLVEESS